MELCRFDQVCIGTGMIKCGFMKKRQITIKIIQETEKQSLFFNCKGNTEES